MEEILATLEARDGNNGKTVRKLGIPPKILRKWPQRYGKHLKTKLYFIA